jgi:TRAP-type C4-dicarboxylate transport system permease small subunit
MDRSYHALRSLILWMGVGVFGILMLNILVSIAARYLNLPITNLDWVEETSRFLFIWLSFLGAALATDQMVHIRIDFFALFLPPRARLALEILVYLMMASFAAVMTYQGILVTLRAGDQSPVLLLPMSLAYLAVPVSGVAILLFIGRILLDLTLRFFRGEGFVLAQGTDGAGEAE